MKSIEEYKKRFETYLAAQSFTRKPPSLYDPFVYGLNIGGKRVRPALLLAAFNMFEDNISLALPAAMGIELFHNFSLIHDDIMDQALIRRGQKTVEQKFGTNTAILSGDAMFVYAYSYLLNHYNQLSLFKLFNETALMVCEGQQLDMEFETRFDVEIEEYIGMITLKTAVLIGCSLQMGAIIANASLEVEQALFQFGKHLGISFQIIDDILDTYANQKDFGKKIGGDIIQNKRTFLLLTALDACDSSDKEILLNVLKDNTLKPQNKIKQVKEIYTKYHVKQTALKKAMDYYDKAIVDLETIQKEGLPITTLESFANQLRYRSV